MLTRIIKRDGREVPFNIEKIANAIFKAAQAVGGSDYDQASPRCGREEKAGTPPFERIRRITGYLVGTLDSFNDAKRAEVSDRVKHGVSTMETI